MALAGNEIVAGLGDPDDGAAALQFPARQPVVEKAVAPAAQSIVVTRSI